MATTYYLLAGTDGSYACGTGFPSGGNRWRMSETAPSTSTTSITISQSSSARFPISTETTEPPGASGGTGTHTATLEVNSGDSNIDLTAGISPHQTQIQRFTSSCGFGGGTIVPDDTLPITLTAGTYTLTWTDADLGTWSGGDIYEAMLHLSNNSMHSNLTLTLDVGSAGTKYEAPWTISDGPSPGLKTLTQTGVGT